METKGIYVGKIVKSAWKTMKDHLSFFIRLLLVAWLIQLAPQIIAVFVIGEVMLLRVVLYLLSIFLSCLISMGLIKISLKFCDHEKGNFGDLFSCYPLFPKYLLGSILYGLIIIGGLILLIFPAVIWGIKFGLFPYFIVEKGWSPIEALRASAETTRGAKWDLLGFWFVTSVITFIGILCLVIGILATMPVTMVATALVYRNLLSQTETLPAA